MPEPDCFLRYRISAASRNFTSGKADVYILAAAASRGFKMVLRPTAPAKRGFTMALLPRDAMHKRGYNRHVVSVLLSVCHVRGSCQNE